MLVLGRKHHEQLVLKVPGGKSIVVTVCRFNRNNVWIGIDAPRDVIVLRGELIGPNESDQAMDAQKHHLGRVREASGSNIADR